MRKFAGLLIMMMAGVIIISDSACTKEENAKPETVVAKTMNDNSKMDQAAEVLALNDVQEKIDANGSMVYKIESVVNNGPGKVPDFKFKVGDETYSFFELTKGKVVFLNFWGTWCPPCRMEIPDIMSLVVELKGKDFIVIGIPQERNAGSAVDAVTSFAKSKGLNYLNFVDVSKELASAFGGIFAVPTTYIIDKDRNISQVTQGASNKEAFLAMINKVLK